MLVYNIPSPTLLHQRIRCKAFFVPDYSFCLASSSLSGLGNRSEAVGNRVHLFDLLRRRACPMSGAQPVSAANALAVANPLGIVETTQRQICQEQIWTAQRPHRGVRQGGRTAKRSGKWADFPRPHDYMDVARSGVPEVAQCSGPTYRRSDASGYCRVDYPLA